MTLETALPPGTLLRSLNGISADLFFTAATEVDPVFRVRGAVRRRYRYLQPGRSSDVGRWRAAAELLVGEVDVRSFGRGFPASAPALRPIQSVEVRGTPDGLEIDVVASSFVWGMVRKMVAAMREVDAGRLSLARLGRAARGQERLTLPMAEPGPLVLWEVEYPFPWTHHWAGPNRHQARWWEERESAWLERGRVMAAVRGALAVKGPVDSLGR
jgi:tRNA pseudouridine38-40 synthase